LCLIEGSDTLIARKAAAITDCGSGILTFLFWAGAFGTIEPIDVKASPPPPVSEERRSSNVSGQDVMKTAGISPEFQYIKKRQRLIKMR